MSMIKSNSAYTIAVRPLFFISCFIVFCTACHREPSGYAEETIKFHDMDEGAYGDMLEAFMPMADCMILRPETEEYLFSDMDKVVYSGGMFYIMDWVHRKIVAFGEDGMPGYSLSRRGRGPGEYLQISDFDVDTHGNVWVIDGQRDRLLKYTGEGDAMETLDLRYEADFIKVLPSDSLFLALSLWDDSKYRKKTILLADSGLGVKTSAVERDKYSDPDYMLPSQGFTGVEDGVLYHRPVSDRIYRIAGSGRIEKVYHIDFGRRTVPDDVRADVERYRDDLDKYDVLLNSVYADDDIVAGSVLQGHEVRDFIIDRHKTLLYMQDRTYAWLRLAGISGGRMIYRIVPDSDLREDLLPADILAAARTNEDILVSVRICDVKKVLTKMSSGMQ